MRRALEDDDRPGEVLVPENGRRGQETLRGRNVQLQHAHRRWWKNAQAEEEEGPQRTKAIHVSQCLKRELCLSFTFRALHVKCKRVRHVYHRYGNFVKST